MIKITHDSNTPHLVFVEDTNTGTIVICPHCKHQFEMNNEIYTCPQCTSDLVYPGWCSW